MSVRLCKRANITRVLSAPQQGRSHRHGPRATLGRPSTALSHTPGVEPLLHSMACRNVTLMPADTFDECMQLIHIHMGSMLSQPGILLWCRYNNNTLVTTAHVEYIDFHRYRAKTTSSQDLHGFEYEHRLLPLAVTSSRSHVLSSLQRGEHSSHSRSRCISKS
jgi:hypothetical protein